MKSFLLRIAFIFTLLERGALAHIPFPIGTLVIPLGEERSFFIHADVEEENETAYSFRNSTNPAVATITSAPKFSQKFFGSWSIKGNAIGTTLMTFHWTYKRDKSGNEGDRDELIQVQVVAPGSSAADNGNFLTGGDPVNTRSGEFFAVEAMDFNLRGPMPLGFSRYYSSALAVTSTLGSRRLHNFDWKLTVEFPDSVVSVRSNLGRVFRFEKRGLGSVWTLAGRRDVAAQLVDVQGGGFIFAVTASQRALTFDTAGRLTKIEDTRGNSHALAYDGANRLVTVADGLGRTLAFTYNAGGRLITVTDHTGRHVDFTYAGNNLATAADTLAKVTMYSYDGAGLLSSFTRPKGNTPFTQVFTGGKVASQTERGTDTTTFAYGAGATTVTQPGGNTMTHQYAPTGEIASLTDEGGKTLAIGRDEAGRRNGVTDREGDATGIAFHQPSGLPAVITNAEGRAMTNTFKARKVGKLSFFDVVKTSYPDGTSEAFTYDERGNPLTRTDRAGKKWSTTYNERGQPLTMTNAAGGVTTFTYDAAGNLFSAKDSGTGTTTCAYDALSRLTTITRPGGATVVFTYDARDRVLTATDERGKTTAFTYDENNQIETATDANGNSMSFTYDVLDRLAGVTDRRGKSSARTFNARRLVASVTDRNGNMTSFDHDERQRPATITDAGGQPWTLAFDDESLLSAASNPVDPPGRIKRNLMGHVVEASNALGQTAALTRDPMQRVTGAADPLGRAMTLRYDKRGQLVGVAEQSGAAAVYTRDALGNVTKLVAPNGGAWSASFTKEGRPHIVTDPLGAAWHFDFDERGRRSGTEFPDDTTETLTYDAASNVTRRQFSGGPDFNFSYDNLNRVASASDAVTPGSGISFTYDEESRLTNSKQDGVDFAAAYDDGGRLITVVYDGGAVEVTYTYDSRNRLIRVTDNVSGATVEFAHDDAGRVTGVTRGNGLNSTFAYDAAGRLTRIQHGAAVDIKYTLNAAGDVSAQDITAPTLPAAPPLAEVFAFGKAGQITTAGYVYDARGRLTAAPGHTLAWDGASRLASNGGVTFKWNALGEIIARTEGATTRYFHHHAIDGAPIVSERADGSVTTTRYYVHTPGGMLLYAIDATAANAESYYHFDHLGSTLALSNEAGAITDSYAHGPYGEAAQHNGASTQPFTWLGALGVRKDGALFHMRARWYDPKTARFLTRDPLPPRLADVKSLNPYSYANSNPMRYVDPRGGAPGEASQPGIGGSDHGGFTHFFAQAFLPAGYIGSDLDTIIVQGDGTVGGNTDGTSFCQPLLPVQPTGASCEWPNTAVGLSLDAAPRVGIVIKPSGAAHSCGGSVLRGALKISENDGPLPRDRFFFTYNYFDNVPGSGGAGPLGALSVAPLIRPGTGFWSRPELRAFVTGAFWNQSANGSIGGPPEVSGTFGLSAGVQMEFWW